MAFDNVPMTKPALMTAAAALALYDAADMTNPATVAAAADALADVVRRNLSKLDRAPLAKATGFRADLLKGLALVNKVTPSNGYGVPILPYVLLEARGDVLRLSGTDMDQVLSVDVAAPGVGAWSAAVDSRRLAKLIAKGAGDVILSPRPTEDKLEVMVGNAISTLPTLPAKDFPTLEIEKDAWTFWTDADPLASMLRFVRPAVSTEETRYYLNGVYFHPVSVEGEARLRLVATDGHRLNLDDIAAPMGMPMFSGVIIPRRTVDGLSAALVGQKRVQVKVTRERIQFAAEGVTVLSKVIDGAFPDYMRVIPRNNDVAYDLDAGAFAPAVTRVSSVSNEKSRSIKLTFGADRLTLTCRNMEGGHAEETVHADRHPPSDDDTGIEIGFNAKYLEEACAALGMGRIQFKMSDPASPVLATTRAEPTRICVLMPLRV